MQASSLLDTFKAYDLHSNYKNWTETRNKHFDVLNDAFAKSHVKRELQRRLQQKLTLRTETWTLVNVNVSTQGLPSLAFRHISSKEFTLNAMSNCFFTLDGKHGTFNISATAGGVPTFKFEKQRDFSYNYYNLSQIKMHLDE